MTIVQGKWTDEIIEIYVTREMKISCIVYLVTAFFERYSAGVYFASHETRISAPPKGMSFLPY